MADSLNNSTIPTIIQNFTANNLDPIFCCPKRLEVESAWWEHVPFASLLVDQYRPNCIVELGTHYGASFVAFCDAMERADISGQCSAIDTWAGDSHAGFYGEDVYSELNNFIRENYSGLAKLIQSKFDDALPSFSDGTIDLLHIDGLHTYEAVKNDFDKWRPKLSERGVVLLHDTNVRVGDFGVHRLWEELRASYRSFEFFHGYGLGLVAVGNNVGSFVESLCSLDDQTAEVLRSRFASIGAQWTKASLERRFTKQTVELSQMRTDYGHQSNELVEKEAAFVEKTNDYEQLKIDMSNIESDLGIVKVSLAEKIAEIEYIASKLVEKEEEILFRSISQSKIEETLIENKNELVRALATITLREDDIFILKKDLEHCCSELSKINKRDYVGKIINFFQKIKSNRRIS